jgi:membrane-associated phospholipid phosphatase
MMRTVTPRQTATDIAARLLTNVFAPAHLVISLLLLVGAASHPSAVRGLAWGILAALLIGVAPYAWVLLAVRRGRFASRHIPERAQRLLPLGVAAGWAAASVGILAILGAPRQLIALLLAMLAGLAVTAAITTRWKISLHTAVASGTATILTIVFGPALLATVIFVVGIGWSRVHERDHTAPQVIVGSLLGAAIAASVFLTLR